MGGKHLSPYSRTPVSDLKDCARQPVVRLEGKLCVFPGIPRLFQRMLDGLVSYLPLPPPSERPFRQQIFTSSVHSPFCHHSMSH